MSEQHDAEQESRAYDADEDVSPEALFSSAWPAEPLFGWAKPSDSTKERPKFSFLRARCSSALVQYLLEDEAGPFNANGDDWASRWHWEPNTEGEIRYWKADWHALPIQDGPGAVDIFIPRVGCRGSAIAAPPRLLAFVEAFRRINITSWDTLVTTLQEHYDAELARRDKKGGELSNSVGQLVEVLCDSVRQGGLFASVEPQLVQGPFCGQQHKDGLASALALSLSLGGSRNLRLRSHPTNKSDNNSLWEPPAVRSLDLEAGDVYLSSPFVYTHGVNYQTASQQDPIIAVQCRLAFQLPAAFAAAMNHWRDNDSTSIMNVITDWLSEASATGQLRLPTLAEVKAEVERQEQVQALLQHSPSKRQRRQYQ